MLDLRLLSISYRNSFLSKANSYIHSNRNPTFSETALFRRNGQLLSSSVHSSVDVSQQLPDALGCRGLGFELQDHACHK